MRETKKNLHNKRKKNIKKDYIITIKHTCTLMLLRQ